MKEIVSPRPALDVKRGDKNLTLEWQCQQTDKCTYKNIDYMLKWVLERKGWLIAIATTSTEIPIEENNYKTI